MILGLTAIAAFSSKGQFLKAMMMVVLGLMLASVGQDSLSDITRFTFDNCGKTKVSVASTADSRVTCISGSAAHNSRTGFWCAKPAGRTFATKLVIAMEERAKPTDASENGGRRMKAQISSHW